MNIALKRHTEISVSIILSLLYLLRSGIPFFKYPFLFLYSIFIIYLLLVKRKWILNKLKDFSYFYSLILALVGLIIFALFISEKIYLIIIKDILNSFILLTFFFVFSLTVNSKNDLKIFINNFIKITVYFAVFLSFINIGEIFNIFQINLKYDIKNIDRNFAILPIFLGITSNFALINNENSNFKRKLYYSFYVFFITNIFLSGSRRGLILLLFFVTSLLVINIIFIVKKETNRALIYSSLRNSFLVTVLSICLFIVFFVFLSGNIKNNVFSLLGSKNVLDTKTKITHSLWRYGSVFKKDVSYIKLYERLWSTGFDPGNPDSGFDPGNPYSGWMIGKSVYPLVGRNSGIVPSDAKGSQIDSTLNLNGEKLYVNIAEIKVKEGDVINASIFSYASENFEGTIQLFIGGDGVNKTRDFNKYYVQYNVSKNARWQKLEISHICNEGKIKVFLSVNLKNRKDLENFKGKVIIAYPNVFKNDSLNVKDGNISFLYQEVKTRSCNGYIDQQDYRNYEANIGNFSLFKHLNLLLFNKINEDIIRELIAKLVSEDSTYYAYNAELVIDTDHSKLSGPRLNRWRFAQQIFAKEYNWKKKIFGGGFDHLNWYGYYFYNDKTRSDWPHNPFLSVLLFSGIIGLGLYIFVFYKAVYYYIKYFKEYYIFFIFFLITFFFSFFSAGSPFDPPIMGFFIILPFFIHSIYKKDKK